MAVPESIRNIERPKNTVVIAYGKNKDKYAVKKRIGCKYDNGRNIPVDGPTIGHIVDGKYVACEYADVAKKKCELKDWANIVLCDKLFKDILNDLYAFYSYSDALKIYCMALLKVVNPGIKDYEIKEEYDDSFLSLIYPGVALSKNTVSDFQSNLGKAYSSVIGFMRSRTSKVNMDHHLLIDGTLKSDESDINTLSEYSRKARLKNSRDISILYAFDLEKMEPVCSSCYPGNMIDETSFEDFIRINQIKSGLLVGDKGFPFSKSDDIFKENEELHYFNPLKRNSSLIDKYHMYEYDGILLNNPDITYKKVKVKEGYYLYSFRDSYKAFKEEKDYLSKQKKNNTYENDRFEVKRKEFGTIVFEADIDMSGEIAYKAYDSRWEIELVMRFYKSALELDETRVHSDYSVLGAEFIDFLASLLTYRLLNEFDKKKLSEKYTYKKIMKILERAKKIKIDNEDWQLIKINPYQEKILQTLELLPSDEDDKPKRKRGRPRKDSVKPLL